MATDLAALVRVMPLAADLGISLKSASADGVVAVLPWQPRLCTAGGVLHGGALMTLADSAGALVAFLGLADSETTATMTSTTQLFRPVTSGQVEATALPLNRGRTAVTVQTSLRDDAGRLIAQTTQIQAIRPAPG